MSADVLNRTVSIAVRSLWGAAVTLIGAAVVVTGAAMRLDSTIRELKNDHWGVHAQVRWSQTYANWNPDDDVPDPLDISQGRTSVGAVALPARRAGKREALPQ